MHIKTYDKDTSFLVEPLGEGASPDGAKFTIGLNLSGGSLIYRFSEIVYMVTIRAITDEVMAFRKENAEHPTGKEVIP